MILESNQRFNNRPRGTLCDDDVYDGDFPRSGHFVACKKKKIVIMIKRIIWSGAGFIFIFTTVVHIVVVYSVTE